MRVTKSTPLTESNLNRKPICLSSDMKNRNGMATLFFPRITIIFYGIIYDRCGQFRVDHYQRLFNH